MSGGLTLLHLAGNVALLLWGLHMVHTGILRAFGSDLRRILNAGLANRGKALLAGLGVTALLQSSTATGLMAASFLASGVVDLVPALAVILGANIGTTLIVQLLTFDVSVVAPILILVGVIAFKQSGKTRLRDLGRVGIGLGLVLLALHLILATVAPVEQAGVVRDLFALLSGHPLLSILLGALMTWAAYSSVAVVLLAMSLAAAGVVPTDVALALVLGANLGNVIPQFLGAGRSNPARRLALGNLIVRGSGTLLTLPFLAQIGTGLAALEPEPARMAANFHLFFNLALAVLFIGLLGPLAKLCRRLLPSAPVQDPGAPRYLTEAALATPGMALADASRETLRMVDILETMLRDLTEALRHDDRKRAAEIGTLDDRLDRLHKSIKLYLTRIARDDGLDEADARRCSDVLTFAINLEHAGDILDKSLREIAAKKIKYRLSFSAEGADEIEAMQERLMAALGLATSVFMTGDPREARWLLNEKVRIRELEQAATESHLRRLREGRPESLETSALHLDILRDLKRIAAHIASVAYPILDQTGSLRPSRVIDEAEPVPPTPASGTLRLPPVSR
ncbi:Na/Pi cotransporter [Hypericibacter adhaerens]|uniref:Na/Pi cotransporter n=1 Tax=Hypericibacter adhaerens TaxID=2602016 RepID=A0A5J6N3N7_9PROT|nr:Na/Pi cotransporter family protein [Hypericibacter adhaerens]QEX24419.1 Na/Pi cotransporter [Hypericibacter adhaerens]